MTELAPRRDFKSVLISVNLWLKKTHFSLIRVIRAIRDLLVLIFVDSKNHRGVIQC
jgi:hypothetical protein